MPPSSQIRGNHERVFYGFYVMFDARLTSGDHFTSMYESE